jgi:sporulation protein YlmC with PRC-barrel domain
MGIVGLAMAPWIAQALRGQPQQQPAQVYVVPGRGPVPPPDAYYSYASPYPDSARATGTYTYYGPDSYQPVRNPFSTRYEELAVTPGTSSSGPAPRTTHAGSQTGQAAVPLAPPKEWRYDEVYQQGWSAVHLLHSAVTGPNNRPIGTVENVLLTPDGQAAGLLIDAQPQSGNPTTLSVPWSQVQVLKGGRVTANIDLSRPEQYAMFGVNSVLAVPVSGSMKVDQNDRQPHPWSVTQLIGDNVMTSDAAGFGVVHDVVFGTDNRIQAIVVHRDLTQGGGGAFAFPFFGQAYGFDPMLPFYPVPYNSQQVAEMPRFDEGKVD